MTRARIQQHGSRNRYTPALPPEPMPPSDRELYEEKLAVLARIKAHFALWESDKRMRTMGAIVLRDIERFEKEDAERTLREGR